MTDNAKFGMKSLLWTPPSAAAIAAAFARARANHPATITLTLIAKLRKTWEKQAVLETAQQRVTSMKAEVFETFHGDLDQIARGQADQHLIDAIVAMIGDKLASQSTSLTAMHDLRRELEQLHSSTADVQFVRSLIAATYTTIQEGQTGGLALLRRYLEERYVTHPDKNLENTLEAARKAIKKGGKGVDQTGATGPQPKYTAEDIERIKLAILLRKALGDAHRTQLIAQRVAMLAERAEQQTHDDVEMHRLDVAITKRCADLPPERLIDVLCAAVARHDAGKSPEMVERLRAELLDTYAEMRRTRRRARQSKYQALGLRPDTPFIRIIIALLAVSTDDPSESGSALRWLRECLDAWYLALPNEQARTVATAFTNNTATDTSIQQHRVRYAALLYAFLRAAYTLSTDVLVLVELGEAAIRQLGDGAQLLYGILSRCYGTTCSAFKYPLSGVLRGGVFQDCAEDVLSWCQLVIDYRLERLKKQYPLPKQTRGAQIYCRFDLFARKRVVAIANIYAIWSNEEALYRAAILAEVPSGPDAGKTLGNPDRIHTSLRKARRGARLRRRTTILGPGVLGRRGARRYNKWLLPTPMAIETLKGIETLLYPELHTEEEIQKANSIVDPWARGKRAGGKVTRIRPAQYQLNEKERPVYLWQLTKERLRQRWHEVRELVAFAPQFEAFRAHLERFLQAAPPMYPQVDMPLLSEAGIRDLPFELQMPPPESYEARKANYDRVLNWFHDFRPSRHRLGDEYTSEKLYDLETMEAQDLEKTAAGVQEGSYQSIWFNRTMDNSLRPSAFALLFYQRSRYDIASARYILVCDLVGEHAAEREELIAKEHGLPVAPQYLVNAPYQQFERPTAASFLFFPIEIGGDYQDRIILDMIRQQRSAPKECKKGCRVQETGLHLAGCAPKAVFSTAGLVRSDDRAGQSNWYVHLPVPLPTPACTTVPDAVIGLHEHEGHYSFAVIDLEGRLIDIGEIAVPDHVGPETSKGQASDNFAFETALAIIRQSVTQTYSAYIGVEKTAWKRDQVSTSARENRERLAFARERIFEIACYKATMNGQLVPKHIGGVAPTRDCANCGDRYESDHGVRLRTVQHCFHCHPLHLQHTLAPAITTNNEACIRCTRCSRLWKAKEPQFRCTRCGWQQYAEYNAAVVVARRTLEGLVESNQQDEGDDDQVVEE